MAESNSDSVPRGTQASRRHRELEDDFPPYFTPKLKAKSRQLREQRAVVDFLLGWRDVDSETFSRRAYMGPQPSEAMRKLLPVRDLRANLRAIRTSLESILAASGPRTSPNMPDSPLLCAWGAIGRVVLPRPGDPDASVLLQIARNEIHRARGQKRYIGDEYLLGLLVAEFDNCSEPG